MKYLAERNYINLGSPVICIARNLSAERTEAQKHC